MTAGSHLIRVVVGTTEGPAEIQRLTEEPPEVRSVVCLDGRAVALPISRDYESFVRRPTGLIERLWGRAGSGQAFRMDVGARITDGLSWQLGAFLAHGLKAAGRLAEGGAAASGVVWATGEVDAALAVRPVDAVARKLELSGAVLRAATGRLWVMVPAEAAEVARTTLAALGLADACCVVGVTDAAAALAEIGLALPGLALPGRAVATIPRPAPTSTAPTASPTANRPRWRPLLRLRPRRLTLLVAAGLLLPLALVACWPMIVWHRTVVDWTAQAEAGDLIALDQRLADVAGTPSCLTCAFEVGRFRDWLATRRPPAGAPLVEVEETRRTTYTSCRAGGDAAPAVRRALTEAGAPGEPGVCHARYVVSGAPYVAIVLSAPVLLAGRDVAAVAAGEASVMLDVPPLWFYPTEERVVVLGSKLPLDRVLVWLRPLLPPPPADLPAAVVARLASLGVSARVVRHRIDPGRAM